MDAFYVSAEIRDNPKLRGKPVAVGGHSTRRGVLSTCNYIARQFGVRSAMPTAIAIRKCPELIVVPGRMDVYKEISQQVRDVFLRYTEQIEPLSLDEAYLDVTHSTLCQGSATLLAEKIRQEIFDETGLTASAGIAPIKFLAKIASDLNKPNGQYTIAPDNVWDFLTELPLNKISGVGKVTFEKLQRLGFHTCNDIRLSNEAFLNENLGKYGQVLWARCHGIDNRDIEVTRIRKSVGVERTFERDIADIEQLQELLSEKLFPELKRRAQRYLDSRAMNRIGVKLKFNDFQQTTKDQKSFEMNEAMLTELLQQAFARGQGKPVRLLGVHIGLSDDKEQQFELEL